MTSGRWEHAEQQAATPVLDVSSEATRALRASVTTASGQPVASHVPFSLSPHATAWDAVRTGADGYEWSEAARQARAIDFVMLVVPVAALFVVAFNAHISIGSNTKFALRSPQKSMVPLLLLEVQ